MNILMFVSVYFPSTIYGGPATVAKKQAEELVRKGHNVTIISTGLTSLKPFKERVQVERIDKGVKINQFSITNKPSKFSSVYSKDLVKWCEENISNYDVCHIHYAREIHPILIARLCMKKNIKFFLQTHGMLNTKSFMKNTIDKLITRKQLEGATGCLTLQEVEENVIQNVAKKSNSIILPNGIDLEDKQTSEWQGDNVDKKTVLFLARLHPRKKVLNFIKMAEIISGIDQNYYFRIVGPDGGDKERAMNLASKLNIRNLSFIGEIKNEDTTKEYASASVYVLPSEEEPFPMSVLESLKIGTPTIVTTSVHNRKILEEGNAAVVANDTPEDLADAVLKVCQNKNYAVDLSTNGKKLIRNKLNISSVVSQLIRIYEG